MVFRKLEVEAQRFGHFSVSSLGQRNREVECNAFEKMKPKAPCSCDSMTKHPTEFVSVC